jgi:hypothetical protein
MAARRIEWQGVDDPRRRDAALVELGSDRLRAAGGSVTDGWVSSWSLTTGPGWVTRELVVETAGPGWRRGLRLQRNDRGSWSAEARSAGRDDLPEPGLADPATVRGALDCDLGLCPVTNTMPILRLGLLAARVPETELLMAWVDMPSLAVLGSRQVYGSADASLHVGREVDYFSQDRRFHARLSVEPDGLVRDYPMLARRVEAAPGSVAGWTPDPSPAPTSS